MSHNVNWMNPYAQREGRWMRGNLHTHSSPASKCGKVLLPQVLDYYAQAGYDFLSVSDHKTLTMAQDHRLVLIPGMEWNSATGQHVGVHGPNVPAHPELCSIESQTALLAAMEQIGGFVTLNHPNWQFRPHYHREELLEAGPYDGLEIFNGTIKFLPGYEIATDKWDYLLAKGRRVIGIACDDFHHERNLQQGWIMVRAAERTPAAILAALQAGNLYCSSGVTVNDIRREGTLITVETLDAQEIQVIGKGGRLLKTVREPTVRFELTPEIEDYVRFTVFGRGSEMAWTQPFFRQ
jgi:hypothetical protein